MSEPKRVSRKGALLLPYKDKMKQFDRVNSLGEVRRKHPMLFLDIANYSVEESRDGVYTTTARDSDGDVAFQIVESSGADPL